MTVMSFSAPPTTGAWQHRDARSGFEVVYFTPDDDGFRLDGCTTAIEDGQTWVVSYTISVDSTWTTRRAQITGRSVAGVRQTRLEADGIGHWQVDGRSAPHLDGCLDVDLESSAMTNALPVHRMRLHLGAESPAPAAYVRAPDLAVVRLEQDYLRVSDENGHQQYDYASPAFNFACRLTYDESGLVIDYPGIAVRAG
jgi:hypothetical protein